MTEQYYLSKYSNIPYSESLFMPDFERVLLVNMVLTDLKTEINEFSDI
jgi:hypothetical protein